VNERPEMEPAAMRRLEPEPLEIFKRGKLIPSPLPTPSPHPFSSGYRIASSSCATGVRRDRDGHAFGTGCARTFCKRGGAKIEAWSGDGRSPADGQAARRRSEGRRVASFAPPQVSELGGERASTRLNSPDLLATIWIRVEDEFTIRTGVFQVIDFAQGTRRIRARLIWNGDLHATSLAAALSAVAGQTTGGRS